MDTETRQIFESILSYVPAQCIDTQLRLLCAKDKEILNDEFRALRRYENDEFKEDDHDIFIRVAHHMKDSSKIDHGIYYGEEDDQCWEQWDDDLIKRFFYTGFAIDDRGLFGEIVEDRYKIMFRNEARKRARNAVIHI